MRRNVLGAALFITLLGSGACAASDKEGAARKPRAASGAGGDAATVSAAGGSVSVEIPDVAGSAGQSLKPGDECVNDVSIGEHVPIDLYVMLDKSGSMRCRPEEPTCERWAKIPDSRWGIVTRALRDFLTSSENAGLGVGLGFFPLGAEKAACVYDCGLQDRTCECYAACGCGPADCACNTPGISGCECLALFPSGTGRCEPAHFEFPAAAFA